MTSRVAAVLVLATGSFARIQDPQLADPRAGSLELVTPDPAEQAKLVNIDGLAFDSFGHLLGVREIGGADGAVVYIDKDSGAVTVLVDQISRADQIALHPSGDLFVTSEVSPESTTDRIYRVTITYDSNDVPLFATKSSLTTSLAIDNPEGVIVLEAAGPFGSAGDLYVCEDLSPGDVFRVDPGDGTTTVHVSSLARPEGMAFGSLGVEAPVLYVAETWADRVLRIDSAGGTSVVGDPTSVGLTRPDNLEFGPDGFLYVSEDPAQADSRILRIAADGTHSVFATGFDKPQGLAFDPATGDLYISEQGLDRVWRVRFGPPARRVRRAEVILEGLDGDAPRRQPYSADEHRGR